MSVIEASGIDEHPALVYVVEHLEEAARLEFLAGLGERVELLMTARSEEAADAVAAWVNEWYASVLLTTDRDWQAEDAEASKLVAAGKIGDGASSADLRAMVRRR